MGVGMEDEVPTGEVYKERTVREYSKRFLYVDGINQILLSKRGAPFHETSPMLYDISAVPTWQKTYAGLHKMYKGEVLGKYPVIQHFLFGSIIRWPGDTEQAAVAPKSAGAYAASMPPAAAMPPPPVPAA